MENPKKMDDLGGKTPNFGNTHLCQRMASNQGLKSSACNPVSWAATYTTGVEVEVQRSWVLWMQT